MLSAKTVADTQILIGNGTGFTAAALSGDVTMSNGGVVTIANDAVTLAKIADAVFVTESEGIGSNDNDTTLPTSAAVKDYVDSVASGLDIKESCRCATTANITLANIQTIDGILLSAGNRVLVKDQTNNMQNGIYICVDGGSWTRATDFDSSSEVTPGAFTFIEQGTDNENKGFVLTTNSTINIG